MKKILALLLVFVMCFSLFTVANAENEIKVVIDDKNQSYDQMPTCVGAVGQNAIDEFRNAINESD